MSFKNVNEGQQREREACCCLSLGGAFSWLTRALPCAKFSRGAASGDGDHHNRDVGDSHSGTVTEAEKTSAVVVHFSETNEALRSSSGQEIILSENNLCAASGFVAEATAVIAPPAESESEGAVLGDVPEFVAEAIVQFIPNDLAVHASNQAWRDAHLKSVLSLKLPRMAGQRDGVNATLTKLVSSRPSLTALDMKGQIYLSDVTLCHVLESLPGLEHLNLHGCSKLTDESALQVSRRAKMLRSLDLGSCWRISPDALIKIAHNCPLLEHLDLEEHQKVTDATIIEFAVNCPMLQSLQLRYCCKITDSAIQSLGQCRSLRELQLEDCDNVTHAAVLSLAEVCPGIRCRGACPRCPGGSATTATRGPRLLPSGSFVAASSIYRSSSDIPDFWSPPP